MKRTLQINATCTIPAAVREHFGLQTGDKLDFRIDGKKIIVTPIKMIEPSTLAKVADDSSAVTVQETEHERKQLQ